MKTSCSLELFLIASINLKLNLGNVTQVLEVFEPYHAA